METVVLLGAGSDHRRRVFTGEKFDWEGQKLITVDYCKSHNPDIVHDLDSEDPWPIPDDSADQVHAYEILEHLGQQGRADLFFRDFYRIWRILKNGGLLCATVPAWDSFWAWGDPSHRRVINDGSLVFLDRGMYSQVGKTPMSDFRNIWKGDFKIRSTTTLDVDKDMKTATFVFVLEAIKPPRDI